MLTRVTISGADDEVSPALLRSLSDEFPFVEWGILRSASREGEPRYPTLAWREQLGEVAILCDRPGQLDMNLSAHFCGQLTRDTLAGDMRWFKELPAEYDRVQLNGFVPTREVEQYIGSHDVEWIIQARDTNLLNVAREYRKALAEASRVSALWDPSGGRGIATKEWPVATGFSLGYAGGITPENVVQVLGEIERSMGPGLYNDLDFWIDLESGVRTSDKFDVGKVHDLLQRAEPLLKGP